jgi:hypothetical protein
MVLDCFLALQDIELSKDERILTSLIIFYEELNCIEDITEVFVDYIQELVSEMYNFFNCNENNVGAKTSHQLIDWEGDSQLIVSAINKVAGKEIRLEPYIHWWTFMAYYVAIGECALSNIVEIRDKITRGKKLEKYEKEFRRNNPQYFNWRSKLEQQESNDIISELWNKN